MVEAGKVITQQSLTSIAYWVERGYYYYKWEFLPIRNVACAQQEGHCCNCLFPRRHNVLWDEANESPQCKDSQDTLLEAALLQALSSSHSIDGVLLHPFLPTPEGPQQNLPETAKGNFGPLFQINEPFLPNLPRNLELMMYVNHFNQHFAHLNNFINYLFDFQPSGWYKVSRQEVSRRGGISLFVH